MLEDTTTTTTSTDTLPEGGASLPEAPRSKYASLINALYTVALTYQRGDLLPHDIIENTLGVSREEALYYSLVDVFEERLLEQRHIAIWPDRDQGWRFLTVQEQTIDLPQRRLDKSKRQAQKAQHALEALQTAALTDHQRLLLNASMKVVKDHQLHTEQEKKTLAVLYKPSPK